MSLNLSNTEYYLRPLPFLDIKWITADLISSLRNASDTANFWNTLINDYELVSSTASPVRNSAGNLSYIGDDGKHYCGVQKLQCSCCPPTEYCGPLSACNCNACHSLDSDTTIKKMTNAAQAAADAAQRIVSDSIFESWLWGDSPNYSSKLQCHNTLLNELHEIALQTASTCLSSVRLRQQLLIYERYFIAVARTRELQMVQKQQESQQHQIFEKKSIHSELKMKTQVGATATEKHCNNFNENFHYGNERFPKSIHQSTRQELPSPRDDSERKSLGLARVCTRAALNFSFIFLRRAWRSGEDIEMCSELLTEALESLQDLPESLLFDTSQVSPLWIEVLERSIKFLRQVALGDPVSGRCLAPKEDRVTALCLLLELNVQKGTLAATLETVILLLLLLEKENSTDDNRDVAQSANAPLVPLLRRFELIGNYGLSNIEPSDLLSSNPTESYLRLFTLPQQENANVDLKQSAVIIMCHLNRLAQPYVPLELSVHSMKMPFKKYRNSQGLEMSGYAVSQNDECSTTLVPKLHEQRIYALGWLSLYPNQYGFSAEPPISICTAAINNTAQQYTAPILNFCFQVQQVTISEDYVIFLTQDGKMYTWSILKPETEPMFIEKLSDIQITSVAAHCEGRHYLALDKSSNAYSWGNGDSGRLGHGDSLLREHPTKIKKLENCVKSVHAGCSYSAAITIDGLLYTWGRGTYGRLGHGNSDDRFEPMQVQALSEHKIVDVALGSGECHTLAVTSNGLVYAWGHGEFGKLGNVAHTGSQLPQIIETLPRVKKVFIGSQFSVALTWEGKLYSWGKSSGARLGHCKLEKHVMCSSTPRLISALQNKVIVDVAIGASHCLALSTSGEVFGWGRNDYKQLCPPSICKDPLIKSPILVIHPSINVSGFACGTTQSIIWSKSQVQGIPTRVPFVIDLCEQTFRLLDQLLGMVCEHNINARQIYQDAECMAVSCLHLLRLQLHALIVNGISPTSVGLCEGSRLLVSLKTRLLTLAGGSNILTTIHKAAQLALKVGWSVLLPTASERAQTLSSILPNEPAISTGGHRFMTDLLVGSLMAEGGLETALNQAIYQESNDFGDNVHSLPLLHLINQLLKNISAVSQVKLSQLFVNNEFSKMNDETIFYCPENASPSLDLLHRFQRLLFSHIHQYPMKDDLGGAEALLSKYMQSVTNFSILSLQKAHEVALQDTNGIAAVLTDDISDTLLYELIIGLIILKRDRPALLTAFDWFQLLIPLLHALDKFNRLICDSIIQNTDDMGWPGIVYRGVNKNINSQSSQIEELPLIYKNDLENEIIAGEKWIIINGYVCDLKNYHVGITAINEFLQNNIGKDLTPELHSFPFGPQLEQILSKCKVGLYAPHVVVEENNFPQKKLLTHFDSERALAYFLGLVANLLQKGPTLQPAELQCSNIIKASIFRGGLQVLQPSNPFDEEKGEARSSSSTAGSTPTETPTYNLPTLDGLTYSSTHIEQRIENLICGIADGRLADAVVVTWMTISDRFSKDNNLIWHQEFPSEHPVQDMERLLTAVLIRHQSLGGLFLTTIDRELAGITNSANAILPNEIAEVIRLVYQTKWSVVRIRQQLNRSYKEVCAPILERLRFLLFEVRPAISLEQEGLSKLSILHTLPRFQRTVRTIIAETKLAKKHLACTKPEDILNVTIQSQNAVKRLAKSKSQEQLFDENVLHSNIGDNNTANVVEPQTFLLKNTGLSKLSNNHSFDHFDGGDNSCIPIVSKISNDNLRFQGNELEFKEKNQENGIHLDSDFIRKLRERWYFSGRVNNQLMSDIVEFVMQDTCDVETVRRAMYWEVQRYQIRHQGLKMFYDLLQLKGLLDAVRYNLFNGYLGLHYADNKHITSNILENVTSITAFQKTNLLLVHSHILSWLVCELQSLVNEEHLLPRYKKQNSEWFQSDSYNSCNMGTYVFLKRLPRARFILSILGILAKAVGPNELSLLINSGVMGTVLGLLRQTGGNIPAIKSSDELSVVYEDTILKQKSNKANLSGPDLAKLMKIGTVVTRGADWKWGDQDGNPPGEGRIISEVGDDGWVRVEWNNGATNSYRMGKEDQYDLALAESALNISSPDTISEKVERIPKTLFNGESHPTKLLRYACTKMLQTFSVAIALHSEKVDKRAVRCITSMFRSILLPNSTLSNICGLDNWTTLGFLKSIAADSVILAKQLTSQIWIEFYMSLLEQHTLEEQDIFRKIHCLRLMQTVLVHLNSEEDLPRMNALVQMLFSTLGRLTLYCSNDSSLLQISNGLKPRILLTTPYCATIAEEIIALLRRLHTLAIWNTAINSFLTQKLCVAPELFRRHDELDIDHLEKEYICVLGVLNTIGGYDKRPRVGLHVNYEGYPSTICGFTTSGKCLLKTGNPYSNGEYRKIALKSAVENADYSVFSLSRMPINEMLLNAWSILLYGPGERKESIPNSTDISLLRSQQIQLALLNANCVLYRHQTLLRKILKQLSPSTCSYSTDNSISDDEEDQKVTDAENPNEILASNACACDSELLIQNIILRATQPSPVKSCYTYDELCTAALNCVQFLAANVYSDLFMRPIATSSCAKSLLQNNLSTTMNGAAVYNRWNAEEVAYARSKSSLSVQTSDNTWESTPELFQQIIEMGFSKALVDFAIKHLMTVYTHVRLTPEQIIQWILEHPDQCKNTIDSVDYSDNTDVLISTPISNTKKLSAVSMVDIDLENESTDSSSSTVDGSSLQNQIIKFDSSKDFESSEQYVMYVRGLVSPGMIVRCSQDFEGIKQGDIGTVLKVDNEGDLNVQVDWKKHGGTYWMYFGHIELLEMPSEKSDSFAHAENVSPISIGSLVRIKPSMCHKMENILPKSVGKVTLVCGANVIVDFLEQSDWKGSINDVEVIDDGVKWKSLLGLNNTYSSVTTDLIDDWSKCIRSLTVSSNDITAKNLLGRDANYWQSCSINQGKHWIRLEMQENILVHRLNIVVNPKDHSHMPSLLVVRVGDNITNMKEFCWISIKPTDTTVPLMKDVREYYPWIEILIKKCRNNGIQCKVHSLNIVGRRKQTDLDLMLLNASFLACEYDGALECNQNLASSSVDQNALINDNPCTVMVWGLNDKEQLGGLKGSKVKVPTYSQTISRLRPIDIVGGSKTLFIVSQEGKVYACGEGTNGRLGLGSNSNVSVPRQVPVLHQYVVKKVAVHSGGKHALALTLDGKVFSWGEGEDGKLGHGNRLSMDKPKLIEALRSKKIRCIACGSSHSAAVTSSGELYTWGLGEYGRLGHGDNVTQLKPKLVAALSCKHVVQVACGSRDAQTLALTEDGVVYSWGDGDFGKLGRGGSEGSSVPHEIERLSGIGIIQIECGAQFSLALTHTGEVWTWGKGDYYRLGHGSDQHIRKPQPIQSLRGQKVIHVAVGALHCLAVTDTGQVYAWGDNDHGQQGSGNTIVNKKPALVIGLDSVLTNRVACGSSHSIAWGLPQTAAEDEKKGPVPFATVKDALGGISLGIYDSEPKKYSNACKQTSNKSLSEILLSLETNGARQTSLNYILNAMSILQARQLVITALTSHSKVNLNDKHWTTIEPECKGYKEAVNDANRNILAAANTNEFIAQGGGEALAEAIDTALNDSGSELDTIPAVVGPLNAFQSLTGSLSMSASLSLGAQHRNSKMSASAMSVMAATITNQGDMIAETSSTGLDDFTSLLGESEAKNLVELLKLSVAGRTGPSSTSQTIAETLIALSLNNATIAVMLQETCITELEDLCNSRYNLGRVPKPIMQESSHPYTDNVVTTGNVKIPGADSLRVEFDPNCSTEKRNDPLVIMDGSKRIVATRSGREFFQWASEVHIPGDEMFWKFTSDSSVNGWGWRFWVHAVMPAFSMRDIGSDRAVLSQPSMPLVMELLDERLIPNNLNVLLRLAAALAACSQLNSLTAAQRIWALKHLHMILLSSSAPKPLNYAINDILMPLIPELLSQYEYEEPQVRGGIHLMHSDYFKALAALACDMQMDSILPAVDVHKWAWFKRYCIAVRVAQSLVQRTELPKSFCLEMRKKLNDMASEPNCQQSFKNSKIVMFNSTTSLNPSSSITNNLTPTSQAALRCTDATPTNFASPSISNFLQYIDGMLSPSEQYEDHNIFKMEHDRQLLQWLNSRPDDWSLSWSGASTIYGWGHNHRGQLGGLEGSRIKAPTPCEALSLLRPVQLAGGEQTLFAVTPDGKLFATGYGCSGRLGVGGTDSWTVPTLVASLQHVFIKKVAVNSGGKHSLALTTDGEVFSWGEGEDGKLGHGNRISYDRPKLIEDLNGIGIVDIACGSAHSAAITLSGHVLTWGKGRYGRLGHGDSEDQLRPKLVEALFGYRAIDIACGSGDAQTLCITDDDNVWSWGDGDYGKLGRGGSDGCKIPVKIESLSGLGVIKVECGSQFSVALTKSGAVYTWGKGDFHRLGHGNVDHVRSPKRVTALQNKKVISIATGSLHCVACTDLGEVYTWGDNDEGQLGDGTVSAIPRPRLVHALVGKHIVRVTCGSAHTLAVSTLQLSEGSKPPPIPPMEYDLVRDLPPETLHARLLLLHHFSELLCPCLAMLPITGDLSLSALKDVLVYTVKEAAFRKVIQTTMVRNKQHGPVIELNRIQVKRSRNKSSNGLAGVDGMKSVFGQMVQKLPLITQEALSLPHRVWKVKFVGESVDDCGGGYSESIAEMCDELQNGSVPLLIPTPNGRGEAGANRDCFLLDPTLTSVLQMNMFRFLGVLMGIAIRTGSPLSLNLAEPVWHQLAGEQLRPSDLTEIDRDYVAGLLCIRNMDDDPKLFSTLELPFSTSSSKGHEIPLSTRYTRITPQNRQEYIRLALNFRLHEFDEQVKAVRDGMSKVIPVPLLSLFSASELQAMVCGSPDIPLGLLKSVATYKGFDAQSSIVKWFWEVMEEFTNQERSLFLRFVWGRTRLPRTITDFRGRDFVFQVLEKNPPDHFLPESYTCFFLLKMPRYSCKAILLEKLKYAIHFCKSIDTDEYARVAMGDLTEATGSEDNSDLDSVASHEP